MTDETEVPSSKLDRLKRGRAFSLACGMANDKVHEMREFMKHDPVMRYAATTDRYLARFIFCHLSIKFVNRYGPLCSAFPPMRLSPHRLKDVVVTWKQAKPNYIMSN